MQGFLGGSLVKNPPAIEGLGSIPGLRRSYMPKEQLCPCATTTKLGAPQLRDHNYWAHVLQLILKPRHSLQPTLHQEKPHQRVARALQLESSPAKVKSSNANKQLNKITIKKEVENQFIDVKKKKKFVLFTPVPSSSFLHTLTKI